MPCERSDLSFERLAWVRTYIPQGNSCVGSSRCQDYSRRSCFVGVEAQLRQRNKSDCLDKVVMAVFENIEKFSIRNVPCVDLR